MPAAAAALVAAAQTAETHRRIGRLWPLAHWRAWDQRDLKRTSQRRALNGLGLDVTCFFGGNRSGKTALARALVVAFALGRDHPMVKAWARRNAFDLSEIPVGPGRTWIVALTSNDSRRYHRRQIGALLPKHGVRWYNQRGRGEAYVEIDVPGHDRPAEIWFKSCDQGRGGMQGDECRLILFDEEPPDYELWEEAGMRIGPEPLRMLLSMTPLKGLTWVYDMFVAPDAAPTGVRLHWLDVLDNPYLPEVNRQKIIRKLDRMSKSRRLARQKGQFVALEGRVYPMFDRELHVVDSTTFVIPPEWPRFRAMDFGIRNPSAVLWAALSPDDQLVIFAEHYQAGWSTSQHARRIREVEGWVPMPEGYDKNDWEETDGEKWVPGEDHFEIEDAWADPAAAQLIQDLADHEIFFRPADNDYDSGVDAVIDRLNRPVLKREDCEDCDGRGHHPQKSGALRVCETCEGRGHLVLEWGPPGLLIFDTCVHTIREKENYVRPKMVAGKDGTERAVKKGDHAMDAERYMARGLKGSFEVA